MTACPSGFSVIEGSSVPIIQFEEDVVRKFKLTRQSVVNVEFEVNLTQSESERDEGKIGVMFGTIGFGGKTSGDSIQTNTTRLKFNIPLVIGVKKE